MPTLAVCTGRHPHPRTQLFWRLSEPIVDAGELERALAAVAEALGGDPQVVDAARVMRLAGSIAWPHKDGRRRDDRHSQREESGPVKLTRPTRF